MNVLHAEEVYEEAQERQARLTRSFFEGSRELAGLVRRGQPAGRDPAQEGSANPYAEFLECLFFYYRADARAAERSTRGGRRPTLGAPALNRGIMQGQTKMGFY